MKHKIVNQANTEHYMWGTNSHGWHFLNRDDLSIIQEKMPPGDSEIKHFHAKSRQFFYILSGKATIEIEDEVYTLQNNEGIEIEPEIPHKFMNLSSDPIEFLVVSMPKSHGDRTDI